MKKMVFVLMMLTGVPNSFSHPHKLDSTEKEEFSFVYQKVQGSLERVIKAQSASCCPLLLDKNEKEKFFLFKKRAKSWKNLKRPQKFHLQQMKYAYWVLNQWVAEPSQDHLNRKQLTQIKGVQFCGTAQKYSAPIHFSSVEDYLSQSPTAPKIVIGCGHKTHGHGEYIPHLLPEDQVCAHTDAFTINAEEDLFPDIVGIFPDHSLPENSWSEIYFEYVPRGTFFSKDYYLKSYSLLKKGGILVDDNTTRNLSKIYPFNDFSFLMIKRDTFWECMESFFPEYKERIEHRLKTIGFTEVEFKTNYINPRNGRLLSRVLFATK